jgi:hypothetical protein
MKKLSFKSVAQIFFFIKLTLIITVALLLGSCSSGWSCKKRYVTTPKSYNFKKHHVIKEFDQYMINKYATKVSKP